MKQGRLLIAGIMICTLILGGCRKETVPEDTAVTEAVVTPEAEEDSSVPETGDLSGNPKEQEVPAEEEEPVGEETDEGAVFEMGYLTVSTEGGETDEEGNYTCAFRIDSKYDKPAVCYTNFISVNGWDYTADKWYYEEIDSEGSLVWNLEISAEELEKYRIESVDRLQVILTLGSERDLTDIDKCGFTFRSGADGEEPDELLAEVKGLTPVYTDDDTDIYLTRHSSRDDNVVLEGILVNHKEDYLSVSIESAAVGEKEATVSGDAIIFPDSAGRFAINIKDNRMNSDLFRDARELTFTMAAADFFDYEELWTREITVPLPEGFADSFSMSSATGAVWIPYGLSGYTGPGTEGKDPYSGDVAGIQFMDIVAEVPMSMFEQNETISASTTAFYMADAFVLTIVDTSGSDGVAYSAGPEAFGAYVADQVSPGAEYSVRESVVAGQSALIVDIRDAGTAYGSLDFSIAAFYYNGVFYGFGAGVIDDACDQSEMFERMLGSIRAG